MNRVHLNALSLQQDLDERDTGGFEDDARHLESKTRPVEAEFADRGDCDAYCDDYHIDALVQGQLLSTEEVAREVDRHRHHCLGGEGGGIFGREVERGIYTEVGTRAGGNVGWRVVMTTDKVCGDDHGQGN